MVKTPPANAGDVRDMGSIPGLGRSPGVRNDNPLQYSCLENYMDRGDWQTTVLGVRFYANFYFFFDFFCDLLVIQQRVVQPPYVGIFNSFSPVIEI